MKTWLKQISVLLIFILIISVIWWKCDPPEPDECSICVQLKAHAPCILNLSTGEVKELELYQPHYRKVGEIASEQTGGTFSFFYAAGLQGIKLTDPWYIELPVPQKGECIDKSHFCKNCRELLSEYNEGYVLLDLYDKTSPAVYAVTESLDLKIRCYEITVTAENDEEYKLLIKGKLNEE